MMPGIGGRRSRKSLRAAVATLLVVAVGCGDDGEGKRKLPFERTEQRENCASYDPMRQAFFGSTHLHTGLSFDASLRLVRPGPRDAYAFARGEKSIVGTDEHGLPTRTYTIDRPLDFGAVTDHSEHFSEMGICNSDTDQSRFSLECQLLRGHFWQAPALIPPAQQRSFAQNSFTLMVLPNLGPSSFNSRMPMCEQSPEARANCDAWAAKGRVRGETTVWQEMQEAAEEFYDRSSTCKFTTFVGYEVTSTPSGTTWHRNVIFRNDRVVERPVTAIDMAYIPNPAPNTVPPQYAPLPDVNKLWAGLREGCLDQENGCDVITIPHNSNLGGGAGLVPPSFYEPPDLEEAKRRQMYEPLVEIFQVKGSSECRYDPRLGTDGVPLGGVGTSDEDCDFELLDQFAGSNASAAGGEEACVQDPNDPEAKCNDSSVPKGSEIEPRSFVRNVLKAGIKYEQNHPGTNPFKLGIVASEDTHNGTMGWHPENETWQGHAGIEDAEPMRELSLIQTNSGGHTVAWAEENSRDAIFEAFKRKETYGTSGTRPIVRFFGGWDFAANICDTDYVRTGYKRGVPMGGDLSAPSREGAAPRFVASASMDDFIKTPIQQIQIIKGWVDSAGATHEKVYFVAGDAHGNATVDPDTCEPRSNGSGYETLCGVFEDPDFNPSERAFYYVRVLENPVCRYSTHICKKRFGVNPLSPDCADQLTDLTQRDAAAGENASQCCNNETTKPGIVQPVIQERAWTSPIWYSPAS